MLTWLCVAYRTAVNETSRKNIYMFTAGKQFMLPLGVKENLCIKLFKNSLFTL